MKVYISGQMTGLPEFNFPAFHAAAAKLRAMQYEVINPAEIDPEPGKPWAEYMKKDIKALVDCDAVCTLDGWQRSRGASFEVYVATQLGIQVLTMAELLSGEFLT